MAGHFIVCGLGRVGYRVSGLLLRLGEPVTVVTLPARSDWMRSLQVRGARVLIGDARDDDVLVEAGVDEARGLLAVIDDDGINVELALEARERRPDLPIVIRLFDRALAHEIESHFGVRRALATSAIAAPSFAAAALGDQVIGGFDADGAHFILGRLVVQEGSPLEGSSLARMAEEHDMAGLAHSVGPERTEEEDADRELRAGEHITVAATSANWARWARLSTPSRNRGLRACSTICSLPASTSRSTRPGPDARRSRSTRSEAFAPCFGGVLQAPSTRHWAERSRLKLATGSSPSSRGASSPDTASSWYHRKTHLRYPPISPSEHEPVDRPQEIHSCHVCVNISCREAGSESIAQELEARLAGTGIDMKTQICFGACWMGPNIVLHPLGTWYSNVQTGDLDEIVAHITGGEPVQRLVNNSDPQLHELVLSILDSGL